MAQKCGTNKSYISKVENNIKEVRVSTLQKIVELGLGGRLEVAITTSAVLHYRTTSYTFVVDVGTGS
jgi:transcriptional regulator with XRE-family HTH domain